MHFWKMEALGNDFIVFGSPANSYSPSKETIAHLCDRHYGIGADCTICISSSKDSDFEMHVFNPDGFEAEICGNALRCSAKYVCDNGFFKKKTYVVSTNVGKRTVKIENDIITTEIGRPYAYDESHLEVAGKTFNYIFVSMGNPHCVVFIPNISLLTDEEFVFYGKAIENHHAFPEGTNVEFATLINENEICMRVWERGIGETRSCSTGSCAVVSAARTKKNMNTSVDVIQIGGRITVETKNCGNTFISGKCNTVFKGNIDT